jgi:UDP-3-O-[3-hydroxymyristoyl] glucosamine N-acyltransferase
MNITSLEISTEIKAEHIGKNRDVRKLINFSVSDSSPDSIMWLSDKNQHQFSDECKGTIIVSKKFPYNSAGKNYTLLIVENPRRAFQAIVNTYFAPPLKFIIEESAHISSTSIIGIDCYIGHNVIIEDNVIIGSNCIIMHNTVVLSDTKIGNHCIIGSNCTIGGTGFGYEKDESGLYKLICHTGNVIIEDNVEIGNNTCIDRAVLGSTVLRENVKVDNLVHIAHGCDIGKNSLVIANAMIAGSTKIGENVWIAPSSSILNKKTIGNNVVVGMGAVVLKNIEPNDVVVGNPSRSIKSKRF